DQIFRDFSVSEMVELMDRIGVSKSILSLRAETPSQQVIAFCEARPDRFVLAAYVDPRRGMPALRELEGVVKNLPVVVARAVPSLTHPPPAPRVSSPLYAKCPELPLPISVNTGIPGPPAPGRCQDPIYLDEVCLFFPELTLVMAHGADPWWAVAIRLMLKYANLHLMTSAYAPKYFPPELIQFMNTRGQDKILFASDHPVLAMDRCLAEARELKLRDGVAEKFLYANAQKLFFSRSK